MGVCVLVLGDTGSGKYEEIVLDVVLMPTGKAVINPYGMPVKALDTQTVPQEIADGRSLAL